MAYYEKMENLKVHKLFKKLDFIKK